MRALGSLLALALVGLNVGEVRAEHASATKLLPRNTIFYFTIADVREFKEKSLQTALGRMLQDPQVRPLVKELYGSVGVALQKAQDELGVTVDDVLALPQGEVCFAVVVPPTGPPAIVGLLDVGENMPTLQKLLDRGAEELEKRGATRTEEKVGEVTIVSYQSDKNANRQIMYFQDGGTLVLGSNFDVLKAMIENWGEGVEESLSSNPHYAGIMNHCKVGEDVRPHLAWYFDPLLLFETVAANNPGGALAKAILPVLGLDGIHGLGGTITLVTDQYDLVVHTHLLLDDPRAGVVELLAFGGGDTEPENWVAADVDGYMTIHVRLTDLYEKLGKLVDSFQGEGAFAAQVQRATERVGLKLEEDVLPALDGRISMFSWIEPPARLNSASTLVGIKLKDPDLAARTLDKLLEKFPNAVTKQTFGIYTYYTTEPVNLPGPGQAGGERANATPSFCIREDYLFLGDRPAILEKALATQGGANERLSGSLDFKLVSTKISRHARSARPAMIGFDRPESGMKWLYDMLHGEGVQGRLQTQAEKNDFFRNVQKNLQDNPLPPFAVLQQYLAPSGSLILDDSTGIHYMGFSLRRKLATE